MSNYLPDLIAVFIAGVFVGGGAGLFVASILDKKENEDANKKEG
jgi:hypothetical protein